MNIQRLKYESAPLADGLAWKPDAAWRVEEKMDGVWKVREIGGALVAGEQMRNGDFYAFDMAEFAGQDLRGEPLRFRLQALDELTARNGLLRPAHGRGGDFLAEVLGRGGEGVVAKHLDSTWNQAFWKCKRLETFDCAVSDASGPLLSVAIEFEGVPAGRVPVLSLSVREALLNGDVIEIAAQSRHPSGKFREPRFIRMRPDKMEVAR